MKKSPFEFGGVVSEDAFTNREDHIKKLKNNLLSGVNSMIISPRRWGKTSLVQKVINELKDENPQVRVIMIDLFSARSQQEFLENFARECIKSSSNKWNDWLESGKEFFSRIVPRLSVGNDPYTDFSLSFDWREESANIDEIINLPQAIAHKKNERVIVCIDEFQNLAYFPDFQAIEKKLRSAWQKHNKVSYCLYGSKRHMMLDIFNNASKPFYKFGDLIMLSKIKEEKWVDFIVYSFSKTGKKIDNHFALEIAKAMKSHSWYVQQMSHYVWNLTEKEVDLEIILKAKEELMHSNLPLFLKETESISRSQLNLLIAIAYGEQQLSSVNTIKKYALGTPGNVNKNKKILQQNDLIDIVGNSFFEILDPVFELWIKRTYPM